MPDQPSFDLQAHSVHSDGTLPAAEVVERAAAAGVELFALTDHDTVDGVPEAAARARELGLALLPRRRAVGGPRRPRGPARPRLRARRRRPRADRDPGGLPRRPRAPDRGDGRPAARARLRARRRPARGPPRGRQADRPPAPRRRRARAPRQRRAARRRGDRGPRRAVPALPRARARRPTSPAAARPSPRRSRSSTPPAASPSGRTRSGTSTSPSEALATLDEFAGAGLDGVECFYVDPHRGADPAAARARAPAGPAHDRLDRLPRPRARPISPHFAGSRFTV